MSMSMTYVDSVATVRPVALKPGNLGETLKGVPTMVKQALSLAAQLQHGRLTIRTPDERVYLIEGPQPGPEAEMIVHDFTFARHLIQQGDIGFAEAYLNGQWDSPNMTAFLELFCSNHDLIKQLLEDRPITRLIQKFTHWLNRNTKRGSRKNIEAHYDLGNAFYSTWLDDTMTYSSAIFSDGANSLDEAQTAKYSSLAKMLNLTEGQTVLEIGCGWGGFAEYAAKTHKSKITALTISQEQLNFARKRMFENGLNELVEIRYQDYREVTGSYDRIASIEMFEAVGEKYWPVYFDCLNQRLAPNGRAGIQAITIRDESFSTYRKETDFIQHYVFPGGMLPSPRILSQLGRTAGLALAETREFGLDYATTLSHWRDRFRTAWPDIEQLGFDERFRRLWEYYLAYCEAGFKSGNIDVCQVAFQKP